MKNTEARAAALLPRWPLALVVYWLLCAVLYRFGGIMLARGIAFNVFLAALPLPFWALARRCPFQAGKWGLAALWLLFLPNSFYMLTDLIHAPQQMEWVTPDWQVRHNKNPADWGLVLLLGAGVLLGCWLGLEALERFYLWLRRRAGGMAASLGVTGIVMLSSIGVYVGRFLRFNSWDILQPLQLARRLLGSLDGFFAVFWLMFTAVILLLFFFKRTLAAGSQTRRSF